MVSQAFGQTSRCRNDVNVQVSVIIPTEGDLCAVRRESGKRFLTLRRTEAKRFSTAFWSHPNIARINERYLGCRHVRIPEHARINSAGGRRFGGRIFCSKARKRKTYGSG